MKDDKFEKNLKEFQCKNCKITWLISSISLIIAISCIFLTARFGNQLNEQKAKIEDELVAMKSLIAGLGLKSNLESKGNVSFFFTIHQYYIATFIASKFLILSFYRDL